MEATQSRSNKKRSPNFTIEEKDMFVRIMTNYREIIENKKTDAVTKEEKSASWSELTEEYNATTKIHRRTEDNLRTLWDNLKRGARQAKGDERQEIFKTGGGSRDPTIGPTPTDEAVLKMLGPSGEGLDGDYAADRFMLVDNLDVENEVEVSSQALNLAGPSNLLALNESLANEFIIDQGVLIADDVQPTVALPKTGVLNQNNGKWTARHSSQLLATRKAGELQQHITTSTAIKRQPSRGQNAELDAARVQLAMATKAQIEAEANMRKEAHELHLKRMRLDGERFSLTANFTVEKRNGHHVRRGN